MSNQKTNENYKRPMTDKKLFDEKTNSTSCKVEISLTNAMNIKNMILNEQTRMTNVQTEALTTFKNSLIELVNNFTNDTNIDSFINSFISNTRNLNNTRVNFINSNRVDTISDISKNNKMSCIVYVSDDKSMNGSVRSIKLSTKTITVDYGKTYVTIPISELCINSNQNGGHLNTISGGYIKSDNQDSHGICE